MILNNCLKNYIKRTVPIFLLYYNGSSIEEVLTEVDGVDGGGFCGLGLHLRLLEPFEAFVEGVVHAFADEHDVFSDLDGGAGEAGYKHLAVLHRVGEGVGKRKVAHIAAVEVTVF